MTSTPISPPLIRDLYARMLLTRCVDEYTRAIDPEGDSVASCRGHEAAQVGSAHCIKVGHDFTLPYYRDLGVVLTIGMTPYEVFRTHLQNQHTPHTQLEPTTQHWGYYKHNTVSGPTPVATQLLHAAGIAFASKLRKTSAVTVAYCGDGAMGAPDFSEAIRFAALHTLPIIFICEQTCAESRVVGLPIALTHHCINGIDVIAVYTAMQTAIQHTRAGKGPILLEMLVERLSTFSTEAEDVHEKNDPLLCCQKYLQMCGEWDEEWATTLLTRTYADVERALHSAQRDGHQSL